MKNWFVVLVLAAVPGCIVVPIPNRSLDGYGVSSQVVDAETLAPIPHARIAASKAGPVIVADAFGRFVIKPVYHLHAAYLIGAISYPVFPFTVDMPWHGIALTVTADGYPSQSFVADADGSRSEPIPDPSHLSAAEIGDTLSVSIVPMRRPQTQASNGETVKFITPSEPAAPR